MNLGIKALLALREADESVFLIARDLLEREMWERIAPHNFLVPEMPPVERAKLLSSNVESLAIALTFFEQMTLHSVLDKHKIMERFARAMAKMRQSVLKRAAKKGWSEAQLHAVKSWIDLYSSTITEAFAETLYPRPQLEPELNASSAA